MKSLTNEMKIYYERRFPGIEFSANEAYVNAHYMGRTITLKTLTSIDSEVITTFEQLVPTTYRTVKVPLTGNDQIDALHMCLQVFENFNLKNPEKIAIAEYLASEPKSTWEGKS